MPRRKLRYLSIVQNLPNSEETNSEQQTGIGSSNVLNIANEPAEIQTESGGTRRTRGRTLLKYLNELNSVECVKVARNSLGQPIGSEARFLTRYLGIIARNTNLLPINYESWHHMPNSNKNQALDNIKDRECVGTTSRQKQKFTHIAGSKSFACAAEDEEQLSSQKVGRLQLFDITHKKKDGSPMTTEVAEVMEKLKDKKAEYEMIASSDSSVNIDGIDN
ncbi:acsF2 [Gossypium arboreum]|uniref:AcsF2 n=1 Tax=Gossypium arboreum TaxID=29729 RepID=A0A0B0NDB3_GOSAR|nr:acsF2 [Gossypium arboreum]